MSRGPKVSKSQQAGSRHLSFPKEYLAAFFLPRSLEVTKGDELGYLRTWPITLQNT